MRANAGSNETVSGAAGVFEKGFSEKEKNRAEILNKIQRIDGAPEEIRDTQRSESSFPRTGGLRSQRSG